MAFSPSSLIRFLRIFRLVIALMVRHVSAKMVQGIFLVFLHLLALRDGGSESFDAGHVRYPLSSVVVPIPPELVAADVQ